MICIEVKETGERLRIEHEIWVTVNRSAMVITPYRVLAKGVGDGSHIWSLGELEGYPEVRIITLAEYEEKLTPPDPDPELSAEEALKIIMGGSDESE